MSIRPRGWRTASIVEPGAVIGPRAEIGAGTVIARQCGDRQRRADRARLRHRRRQHHQQRADRRPRDRPSRLPDRAGRLRAAPGEAGGLKVPQVGRVIIQDGVEIGAGTTIDRGAIRDTVIGEGTKIDNLVQVGHNASIGRHCIVAAQTGISGSAAIEDFAVLSGRVQLKSGHE